MKHILLLNRSFWPDIEATGQFLTELCEEFAKRYKVTVIAGRSYYVKKEVFEKGKFYSVEMYNGIEILRARHTRFWKGRLLGRLINWLTYGCLAFIVALRIKSDLIIACTDPPFLGIAAMVIGRLKSTPFIYNCRDLYPDVALALGKLRHGILSEVFDYFNKGAFLSARLVVPVGQSMGDRIGTKGIPKEKFKVIPDWVDTSVIKPIPKGENPLLEKFGLRDKFVIMHSGNIGLSQDFSHILKALKPLQDQTPFYLTFVGEGAGKDALRNEVNALGIKNALFISYQPQDMLSFSLSMADLHIVTLKKGMAGAVVPSKVYGIMAAGRPYLALTDKEAEPARFAEEFGCGLWAPPDNMEAIAKAMEWSLTHRVELEEMGRQGRRVAETRFDKNLVLNKWFDTVENLEKV